MTRNPSHLATALTLIVLGACADPVLPLSDAGVDARPPVPRCVSRGIQVAPTFTQRWFWSTAPDLVRDNHGGVIARWNVVETDGSDVNHPHHSERIYLQRFDRTGKPLWSPAAGVPVSPPRIDTSGATLRRNSEDRWLLVWMELQNPEEFEAWSWDKGPPPTARFHTRAQVFDAAGRPGWPTSTLIRDTGPLCLGVLPDGSSGFVVMCNQGPMTMQRLSAAGKLLWPEPVVLEKFNLSLWVDHADGKGGAIYTSLDEGAKGPKGGANGDVNYIQTIQHVDGSGQRLLGPWGAPLSDPEFRTYGGTGILAMGTGDFAQVLAQGTDVRVSDLPYDKEPKKLLVARVNLEGKSTWPFGGRVLVADTPTHKDVRLAVQDGKGGLVVAWHEDRDGDGKLECWGQRVLSDGSLRFEANGRWLPMATCSDILAALGNDSIDARAKRISDDGFVHAFLETHEGLFTRILKLRKLDWDLNPLWSESVELSRCPDLGAAGDLYPLKARGLEPDGEGGVYVLFQEAGSPLRLAHISGDGKPTFQPPE